MYILSTGRRLQTYEEMRQQAGRRKLVWTCRWRRCHRQTMIPLHCRQLRCLRSHMPRQYLRNKFPRLPKRPCFLSCDRPYYLFFLARSHAHTLSSQRDLKDSPYHTMHRHLLQSSCLANTIDTSATIYLCTSSSSMPLGPSFELANSLQDILPPPCLLVFGIGHFFCARLFEVRAIFFLKHG
jgi:hypothetical protein